MFVSFAVDNGIRFTAHFYDQQADKVETRPVSGWVMGDDGISQATVLIPDGGVQLRVGSIGGFLAVTPNGQDEAHKPLLDARLAALKDALKARPVDASSTPTEAK